MVLIPEGNMMEVQIINNEKRLIKVCKNVDSDAF